MTNLPHPFLHHTGDMVIPKDKRSGVNEIYKWIKEQPKFPNLSKNHAYLFYHACLYNKAVTKKSIARYIEMHTIAPELFANRDPFLNPIQQVFDMVQLAAIPKTTTENYKVLIYRLIDFDSGRFHFAEAIKAFSMFNDVRICEDGLVDGYVIVFDMKGLRLSHLTRVRFGPLQHYMSYIQEAHPVRLKKIYVINTAFFINQVMALVKPLINKELLDLVQFSTGSATSILPPELLPADYGGDLDTMENYHKDMRTKIETKYRDWLIDSSNLRERVLEDKENNNNYEKNYKAEKKNIRAGMKGLTIGE